MANYDPKRGRPVTEADAGPSQVDALLDGGDRRGPAAITTDDGVVDLRGDAEPASDHLAVPTVRVAAPLIAPPGDGGRSPIEPVRGPDHRSRRLVTTLIATACGLGILAIIRTIQRSRRS